MSAMRLTRLGEQLIIAVPHGPDMNGSTLRILDANLNRAREALRVLEDYARFAIDDGGLCQELKLLRHELVEATRAVADVAILHRDTPGDVGTAAKTTTETARSGEPHVITAAGKRLGEALRVIEEYLKIEHPGSASKVEKLRYRFYDAEQRIARTLKTPGTARFASVRLYVLITESACKRDWYETAALAIEGGADCLQLREKHLDGAELLTRAKRIAELCRSKGVISIINDRPDIALLSGADGVHVGQDDVPAVEVRKLLGRDKIVGVSTHSIEHARQAILDGADYIGVGPVFRSPTKPRDFLPGLELAREVARSLGEQISCVAIAGITEANVDEVLSAGFRAVAVASAVTGSDDSRAAAARLKAKLTSNHVGQTFLSASNPTKQVGQTFLSASNVGIPTFEARGCHPKADKNVCPTDHPKADKNVCPTDHPKADKNVCPTDHPKADKNVCPTLIGQRAVTKRQRRLPHWTIDGATYFVTFRVASGELSISERVRILEHIRSGDGKFYRLLAAVVMPDHVHELLAPLPSFTLARVMKGTKGMSARLINEVRGASGAIWQEESFDRVVRDQTELEGMLEYVVANPAKRGLVSDPWDYPALYVRND